MADEEKAPDIHHAPLPPSIDEQQAALEAKRVRAEQRRAEQAARQERLEQLLNPRAKK